MALPEHCVMYGQGRGGVIWSRRLAKWRGMGWHTTALEQEAGRLQWSQKISFRPEQFPKMGDSEVVSIPIPVKPLIPIPIWIQEKRGGFEFGFGFEVPGFAHH